MHYQNTCFLKLKSNKMIDKDIKYIILKFSKIIRLSNYHMTFLLYMHTNPGIGCSYVSHIKVIKIFGKNNSAF